jgi:hypothetical protein
MDYVFRYKLDRENPSPPGRDRLLNLVRTQLQNMLDIVSLSSDGKEIKVDGFKLLSDKTDHHPLTPPTRLSARGLDPSVLFEPRIEFIKKQLESLLSVVDLEGQGGVVRPDGFRLKCLDDWLVRSDCDPSELLEIAATRCNCDCLMCYNKGNPPSLALTPGKRSPREELSEIKTRLRYFFPEKAMSLFPSPGCTYDAMAHPFFFTILRHVREKTSEPLRVHTNGNTLTPSRIRRLAAFKPVYLYLSINSSSPERRRKLMNDRRSQTAISALERLRKNEIPYAAVIVPWPAESIPQVCKDLSDTMIYADECGAHLIQINLPGYSKWFSSGAEFNREEVWRACIDTARALRGKLAGPIVTMPSMYEENLYEEPKNLPKIMGLVRHSPGDRCGLSPGDILLGVNNISITTRPQARDVLSMFQKGEIKTAHLRIQRDKKTLERVIHPDDFSYPFTKEFDHHLGIVFMGTGLRVSSIELLKDIIDSRKAKTVLFLSSELVKPVLEQCLRESRLLHAPDLRMSIRVPRNNYFGGNVFMGDLLVVQDFIDCIKEFLLEMGKDPDLIVIPSSPFNLGRWGRDLTGRVYLDIERDVGIPVELLECDTIYD